MPRILFLLLGLILATASHAQPLRVVTWRLVGFPLPASTNNAPPVEVDPARLKPLAALLQPLEADIIILDGLSDKQLATKLISQMKPAVYHLANHSHFRNGPNTPIVAPPITILAKKRPLVTRSAEWKNSGLIDAPGGFVFAAFAHGTNSICVYDAGLPLPVTNRYGQVQEELNLRHRELAAQYLVHHGNWLAGTLTNPVAAMLFSGDFIPAPQTASVDRTLRALEEANFRSDLPGLAASRRAVRADLTIPLSETVLPLFTRNADFAGAPAVAVTEQSGPAPVTWDLIVNPLDSPPVRKAPAPEVVAAPALTPESQTVPAAARGLATLAEDPKKFIWLGGALVAATLIGVLGFQWLAWRRWSTSLQPARRIRNAVTVDFGHDLAGEQRLAGGRRQAGMLTEEEGSGPEMVAWQQRALKAEQRAQRAASLAQSGLKPHLLGLMREKLVWWLNSQRSHLLDSHETGTAQVMELEERLEKIQSQFQDRLVARDQRIVELEQELVARKALDTGGLKPHGNLGGSVQASNE